jgi:hypothetical protein
VSMATTKAHWGKPIWVTEGGAELPVLTNTISTAMIFREPNGSSLDQGLGSACWSGSGPWTMPAPYSSCSTLVSGSKSHRSRRARKRRRENSWQENIVAPSADL